MNLQAPSPERGTGNGKAPPRRGAPIPPKPALGELRQRPQWVAWNYVWKADKAKWDKPPINPHTGKAAKTNDPRTWGTYEEAAQYARAHGLPGVGFVLTEEDDLTGIDLDKCCNGTLEPWARAILREAETYAELSPSKT